jgi:hypothetical protein
VGERLEKDLEHLGLEAGAFETDALAGGRCDRGIDIKPHEDVLDRPDCASDTGLPAGTDTANKAAKPPVASVARQWPMVWRWTPATGPRFGGFGLARWPADYPFDCRHEKLLFPLDENSFDYFKPEGNSWTARHPEAGCASCGLVARKAWESP